MSAAVLTGHHPSCVCGSCSQMRGDCPASADAPDGHDWHEDGAILTCSKCDKRARWARTDSHAVPLPADSLEARYFRPGDRPLYLAIELIEDAA